MRSVSEFVACSAALGLVLSSTAAAAAPAPSAMAAQPQAPNAWLMLSALGPTRAVALGGAAATAQPKDGPPPPPVVAGAGTARVTGEFIPFILWFALIAVALSLNNSGDRPNTPP